MSRQKSWHRNSFYEFAIWIFLNKTEKLQRVNSTISREIKKAKEWGKLPLQLKRKNKNREKDPLSVCKLCEVWVKLICVIALVCRLGRFWCISVLCWAKSVSGAVADRKLYPHLSKKKDTPSHKSSSIVHREMSLWNEIPNNVPCKSPLKPAGNKDKQCHTSTSTRRRVHDKAPYSTKKFCVLQGLSTKTSSQTTATQRTFRGEM